MNTNKVKRHRNSDTKTGNREPQQNDRLGTVSNELLGLKLVLCVQPHPQFLKWYKTFSWLFGSHDNPLTRQRIIKVNHVLIPRRCKDEESTDTTCCVRDGDPWSAKQHSWKSEAKEDHQLSPSGPTPSLHLACNDFTAPAQCLNSRFRAVSVRRPCDIVRFHGRRRVAVACTILYYSGLYKK